VWAGVDNVWEQEKPEARKMLENAAESHTSGARFVGWLYERKTRRLKKDTAIIKLIDYPLVQLHHAQRHHIHHA
jgi:hypothetical protein